MKRNAITRLILCFLSFAILSGVSISKGYALSYLDRCGYLSMRIIHKIIKQHEGEIRYCYEKALLKDKTLTGKVTTIFVIKDGKVLQTFIKESTLKNREVEQCMKEHIQSWTFPRARSSCSFYQVEYPYEFVSNYKPPTVLEHLRVILNEDDMIITYIDEPHSQQDSNAAPQTSQPEIQSPDK